MRGVLGRIPGTELYPLPTEEKRVTKREQVNRDRCIAALEKHFLAARERGHHRGGLLYGLLDAALRKLKPSQADAARKNALQFLRRRGHNRAVRG